MYLLNLFINSAQCCKLFNLGAVVMKSSIVFLGLFAATALAPVTNARSVQPPATVITAGTQKAWSEGQKRVEKGEERIARGEEDIRDADKMKREAESMQADGNARTQSTREAYARYLTGLSPAQDFASIRAQADAISEHARRLEKAQDLVKDGEKRLRKSEELRTTGEKRKVEGNSIVAEGNSMKSQAEGLNLAPLAPIR
jgi:type IV secretory pathway TrbL component